MATLQPQLKRIVLAGGFALAVAAAPAFAVVTVSAPAPAVPVAQPCSGGEEADPYTGNCVPHTVPSSASSGGAATPFQGIPGNPDIPAVSLPGGGGAIPCTGANTGECIGLAEEDAAMGPQATPHSEVGSSPTVHGHLGP